MAEYTCDLCGNELKVFMLDLDGTNLEEAYGCPACEVTYVQPDIKETDHVIMEDREGR